MEGKTNFSRSLKQFDGLTWLIPTPPPLPLFYDSATPLRSLLQLYSLHYTIISIGPWGSSPHFLVFMARYIVEPHFLSHESAA